MALHDVVKPFKHLNTLIEKMKLLAREVFKENEALTYVQASLPKVEVALAVVEQSLDPARKKIEELEKSLKESQEIHRRFEDDLRASVKRIFLSQRSWPSYCKKIFFK